MTLLGGGHEELRTQCTQTQALLKALESPLGHPPSIDDGPAEPSDTDVLHYVTYYP